MALARPVRHPPRLRRGPCAGPARAETDCDARRAPAECAERATPAAGQDARDAAGQRASTGGAAMGTNRLADVAKLGQSIWYDNIRRGLITSGDLQRLIDDDAVVGITSNPSIFEKAIDDSADYDDQMKD